MWSSEGVVVVKADQLGLPPGQPLQQVSVVQEGAVGMGEPQAFMLPQNPIICISVLGEQQQQGGEEEEEEEEEEERRTIEEASPASPGEVVTLEIGGDDDPSAEGLAETTTAASEGSGSVLEEADAEAQAEDDPDYDPECESAQGHRAQGHRAFQCQQCQRRFSTRQGLERHTHIHAAASTAAAAAAGANTHALKCRFCTKTFGTQFGRRRHERRHESERKRLGRSASASVLTRPASTPTRPSLNTLPVPEPSAAAPSPATALLKVELAAKIPPPVPRKGSGDLEESSGEQKGAHICRHCHKAFGTHTNLRRHQRRVHERHLLPRRLASATAPPVDGQKSAPSQPSPVEALAVGGGGGGGGGGSEEEVEREEYMVDISSNISENLSFYIDGKIVSTSALSGCEVIEINSGSTAVIGLDTLIISPAQIAQALKMQSGTSGMMSRHHDILGGQSSCRRRTATPPLLPQIKTELESEPILTTTSSSSSPASFLPSVSTVGTVVGTVLSQPADAGGAQKEKTVYLSPKLKQLLQTQQEGCKPTFALIADGNRLAPPLSLAVLPSSSRFKRRTGSPPSTGSPPNTTTTTPTPPTSQQQSPTAATECGGEAPESPPEGTPGPAPEALCSPHSLSCRGDLEPSQPNQPNQSQQCAPAGPAPSPLGLVTAVLPAPAAHPGPPPLDWSEPRTGGSPCNQQPLDLSSAAVSRREGSEERGESALDLSMPSRAAEEEPEEEGAGLLQLQLRKAKPSSSMLQQVLMSDCASLAAPSVGDQGANVAALVTDVALVTAASVVPANPERLVVELALPPAPVQQSCPAPLGPSPDNPTPAASSSVVMVTSAPAQLLPVSSTSQPAALALLPPKPSGSGGAAEASAAQEAQVKAVLPHWGGSVPVCLGGVESLQGQAAGGAVPTVGEMSLAGPTTDFVTPLPTLQAFAASVNESAIQSYSIVPNAVVIECTVSLESSQTFVPTFPGGTIESPYGKIILGPSEHLQPYSTPQLHQAPKPTLPPAGVAPNTDPPSQANPSLPAAAPAEEQAAASSVKDESGRSDSELGEPSEPSTAPPSAAEASSQAEEKAVKEEAVQVGPLGSSFVCNVCSRPFCSMKELGRHIGEHSEAWPFKCEFCVQLFESAKLFLDHRSTYHGIGKIYVCSACSKEFAFLCNLQQHQRDLHPGQSCSHTEVEDGRLRPQNYNSPNKDNKDGAAMAMAADASSDASLQECERMTRKKAAKREEEKGEEKKEKEEEKEEEFDTATEELYTTIKIMASGVGRSKGPDVRLGINQHYPSFKPPPFPYHNRTPTGSVASATNFTTHNIPQTFSTAIRCTKCGQSFDNMPELHRHILACANASDKRRYTPKKNPIPLKQFARAQNGVLSPTTAANIRQNVSRKAGAQGGGGGGGGTAAGAGKRPNGSQEALAKLKLSSLSKRKAQLVQRAVSQRNKAAGAGGGAGLPKRGEEEQGPHVCPHCRRVFTYRASLSKHMALSCPSRPLSKRARKRKEGGGVSLAQENNANMRRRSPESAAKQQGALQTQRAKLVAVRTGEHAGLGDMKRSAILISAPGHAIKRSKNGSTNVLSPIPESNSPSNPQPQPLAHTQPQPQPLAQTQDQTQPQAQDQTQAQQSVPIRVRERQGGPVTRSLQQARSMAPPSGLDEAAGAGAASQPEEPPVGSAGRK